MDVLRVSRPAACGLLVLASASGCLPAYFRQIEPSFVAVDAPVDKIEVSPQAATVVVYDPEINTLGPQQAITLVLKDGTALGQAPPKGWVTFEVPPGEHTIAEGVPEIGSVRPCAVRTGKFEAGKIYVLARNGLIAPPKDAHPERALSLMSRLRVDRAAGQARVRGQWNDFWASCIADAEKQSAALLNDPSLSPAVREKLLARDGLGEPLTELTIPPPP